MAMSESGRSFKRKAPVESPTSERLDDASTDDRSSVPGTATYVFSGGSFTKENKAPRRRRKFNEKRRREVANVRRVGACDGCRSRKVRCTHVLQKSGPDIPRITRTSPPPPINFESVHSDLVKGDSESDLRSDESQKIEFGDPQIQELDIAESLSWEDVQIPMGRLDQVTNNVYQLERIIEGSDTGSQQPMPSDPWTGLENSSQNFSDRLFIPITNHLDARYAKGPPRGMQKKGTANRLQPHQQNHIQLPIRSVNKVSGSPYQTLQHNRTAAQQNTSNLTAEYQSARAEPQFQQVYAITRLSPASPFPDYFANDDQDSAVWSNCDGSQGDMPRPPVNSQFTMGLAELPPPVDTGSNMGIWKADNSPNLNSLGGQPPMCANTGAFPDVYGMSWDLQPSPMGGLSSGNPHLFPGSFCQCQPNQYSGAFPLPHGSAMAGSDFAPQPPFNEEAYQHLCGPFNSDQTPSTGIKPPSMYYGPSSSSSGGNEIEYAANHDSPYQVDDPGYWKLSTPSKLVRKVEYDPREQRL